MQGICREFLAEAMAIMGFLAEKFISKQGHGNALALYEQGIGRARARNVRTSNSELFKLLQGFHRTEQRRHGTNC